MREKPKKLSYKIQRELEELPKKIEQLDTERSALQKRMADPAFYQQGKGEIDMAQARMAALDEELARAYVRWEELEALRG